jgi:hypothetical protein
MLELLRLADFPDARVLWLPDAGHYLQEDAHGRIVPALLEFLRGMVLPRRESRPRINAPEESALPRSSPGTPSNIPPGFRDALFAPGASTCESGV